MDISAAIFDCDGTLVDSMPMWRGAIDWLFEHHGMEPDPTLMDRIEPLSVAAESELIHEEYGLCNSGMEVYEELCEHLRYEYTYEVPIFDGVVDFLEELRQADIPMIVASSTPAREVKCALKAHGISDYFQDVVSTEAVGGRDKEHPDVYLEAVRRLGTPIQTTWVFEDAPFGVQTAHRVGFPVVGLMNDHDGRREEDVRPYCDIYSHGFQELSLALIYDYERPSIEKGPALRALVVDGSPEPSSSTLVAALAAESDYVVCADAGANMCQAAGVVPNAFCGDFDSADEASATWARDEAAICIQFPAEKYATDLSLALDSALHEAERRGAPLAVTLTCASGGRPDHALAVVGQLVRIDAVSARIVEDGYEMRVLRPEGEAVWELGPHALGKTFSLIALEEGTRVDISGMRWELSDVPLDRFGDRGISNIVTSADACVSCHSGLVLAYLFG